MAQEVSILDAYDILQDTDFQVRGKINTALVNRYATNYKAGANMPPVEVAEIDGKLVLVDGWHRLWAQQLLERHDIEAVVTPMTTKEARWRAAEANLTHGMPLKTREAVKVFKAYVKAGKHRQGNEFKSYRTISHELHGLRTYGTIRNWMFKFFPKTARRMGNEEMPQGNNYDSPKPLQCAEYDPIASSLDNLITAFGQTSDPRKVDETIEWVEEVLERLKQNKKHPWLIHTLGPHELDEDCEF